MKIKSKPLEEMKENLIDCTCQRMLQKCQQRAEVHDLIDEIYDEYEID